MVMTALFGRHQPGGLFNIKDMQDHPRYIWFVDSGHASAVDDAGHGKSPDAPFATLGYAYSSDLLGSGDVVYVMPGHTETVTATSLVPDIAGVKVIGLGRGSSRPTLTFSVAGSILTMSGANTRWENFLLLGTAAVDVTTAINVTGADVELVDI